MTGCSKIDLQDRNVVVKQAATLVFDGHMQVSQQEEL